MNTTVVGKALYLELRRGGYTTQVLVTPEAIMLNGKVVPMTCYKRRISSSEPRKTWKQVSSMFMSEKDPVTGAFFVMNKDHALATVPNRLQFVETLFMQMISQGYSLFKSPITVEVTHEDLEDIRKGSTPYKILGRVTRCRRALNFGESLFSE